MLCATAQEYSLTFRCINCGRYEASANYSSDEVLPDDQIKAQIYRVRCTACGWKGEACGVAAIRILRTHVSCPLPVGAVDDLSRSSTKSFLPLPSFPNPSKPLCD